MAPILSYVEYTLGTLLSSVRGHDAALFTRSPQFATTPPTITVTSPEAGATGSPLAEKHTPFGANAFPSLTWALPPPLTSAGVAEYILVVEDADAPLPFAPLHGMFLSIPATKTSVTAEDFEKAEGENESKGWLKGGFRFGKNLRGTVYGGPRPVINHGVHRYFYQVLALSEVVGANWGKATTKAQVLAAVQGKVVGWGEWVGTYERTL